MGGRRPPRCWPPSTARPRSAPPAALGGRHPALDEWASSAGVEQVSRRGPGRAARRPRPRPGPGATRRASGCTVAIRPRWRWAFPVRAPRAPPSPAAAGRPAARGWHGGPWCRRARRAHSCGARVGAPVGARKVGSDGVLARAATPRREQVVVAEPLVRGGRGGARKRLRGAPAAPAPRGSHSCPRTASQSAGGSARRRIDVSSRNRGGWSASSPASVSSAR